MANDPLNALLVLGYSVKGTLPVLKQLPEGLSLEESIPAGVKGDGEETTRSSRSCGR